MGACNLIFCSSVLAIGKFRLGLNIDALRTLAVVVLVFSGQAVLYVVRERRRLWSSRPSVWLMFSSIIDISIITTLATRGILMTPLQPSIVVSTFAAAAVFAFVLDQVKHLAFMRLKMA